ncbi:hypothetical protein BKI52_05950 [marine bacterium AO1-C]|nr:hypothetical protein BKI52_05950 [marine bacterium AO1-C]
MLHLITEENQHEYKVRFIGALIAFPIPPNFLEIEPSVFYITLLFAFGFPIWGIMLNVLGYFVANLAQGFVTKLSPEQVYRCFILGHLPMVLVVFSIPAFGLIPFQRIYLLTLWGISLVISIYLLQKVNRIVNE